MRGLQAHRNLAAGSVGYRRDVAAHGHLAPGGEPHGPGVDRRQPLAADPDPGQRAGGEQQPEPGKRRGARVGIRAGDREPDTESDAQRRRRQRGRNGRQQRGADESGGEAAESDGATPDRAGES